MHNRTPVSPPVRPTREELVAALNEAPSIQDVARQFGVSRMTLLRWRNDYGIEVTKAPKAA